MLKVKEIPYLESGGFTIKRAVASAHAHSYRGRLAVPLYSLRIVRNVILNCISRSVLMTPGLRVMIQRIRGVKIGKNVSLVEGIVFDEVYPEMIAIEDDAAIAPYAIIMAHQNPPVAFRNAIKAFAAPVTIKKGAWVCARSIILPGVTIGEYSIVGAGSVVTSSIPPSVFAAGAPAKVIRKLKIAKTFQLRAR